LLCIQLPLECMAQRIMDFPIQRMVRGVKFTMAHTHTIIMLEELSTISKPTTTIYREPFPMQGHLFRLDEWVSGTTKRQKHAFVFLWCLTL